MYSRSEHTRSCACSWHEKPTSMKQNWENSSKNGSKSKDTLQLPTQSQTEPWRRFWLNRSFELKAARKARRAQRRHQSRRAAKTTRRREKKILRTRSQRNVLIKSRLPKNRSKQEKIVQKRSNQSAEGQLNSVRKLQKGDLSKTSLRKSSQSAELRGSPSTKNSRYRSVQWGGELSSKNCRSGLCSVDTFRTWLRMQLRCCRLSRLRWFIWTLTTLKMSCWLWCWVTDLCSHLRIKSVRTSGGLNIYLMKTYLFHVILCRILSYK